MAGGVDPYNHRYKRGEYSVTWHRNGELVEDTGHVTDLIACAALDWIASRGPALVLLRPVHRRSRAHQAAPVLARPLLVRPIRRRPTERTLPLSATPPTPATWTRPSASLSELLEATGQRDNTIIVFSSDNGAINGAPLHSSDRYPGWQEACPRLGSNLPFRGVKAQFYEGGIRTPTVINWRGQLMPGTMAHPVHVVDWMPTFCNLLGATPQHDPQWDGVDIWPLLAGMAETPADRTLFWNFRGGTRLGARADDWKLIVYEDDERQVELFNVAADPYEEQELAAEHPGIVRELSELIREQRSLDDTSRRDDVTSPQVA